MKLGTVKLINYIGLFNGLGLNEIFIDFTKCKNKITIIKGANGCGKSELFKSLHMFPDSNDRLIPGLEARKEISYIDGDFIYYITIKHGIKKDGSRDTTKAYITKITQFDQEELNPNGNISSYKDIVYSIFRLDSNFLSLSELSSNDRGLGDKTPSERKKLVNSIISSIQVYNDIHKSLTKRSSVFKSMVVSINNKIASLGDEEQLRLTLTSLENRINQTINDKDRLIEELAGNKSKIEILDPDGSIQNTSDEIYQQLLNVNKERKGIEDKISTYINKLNIDNSIDIDKLLQLYKSVQDIISSLEISIKINESKINTLLVSKETEAQEIQKKSAKLATLQCDRNYIDLEKAIKVSEDKISQYLDILNKIGLTNMNITKDEFILGLNTLGEIKETIDIFKSGTEYEILNTSINYVKNNYYPDINEIDKTIERVTERLNTQTIELQKSYARKEILDKLKLRPSNCTINECPFIKDAVDIQKDFEDIDMYIDIIEKDIKLCNDTLDEQKQYKIKCNEIIECINCLKSLIRNLEKHSSILNKLPINNILANKNILLDNISNGYEFKEIDELYSYLDYANVIEEYKNEINTLQSLKSDYKVYESKANIINEIMSEIDTLNNKLQSMMDEINKYNEELKSDKAKLSEFKSRVLDLDLLIDLFNNKIKLDNQKADIVSRFECIRSNIMEIKKRIENVNVINGKINLINEQMKPMLNDRDVLAHSIGLLSEYKEELKIYSEQYEKVETIKKYSSPSKGIQTLFMSLYMNKTISMANELLGYLFEGRFVLGEFEINENEFRIPCLGNNMMNNDISSMSTAQISMISMILSFVLLRQSSTNYNILKLDEIDGALDTQNRILFINMLYKLIGLLDVEQCIMISHNNEMDLSNCDVIQLKMCDNDDIEAGNIIYKY